MSLRRRDVEQWMSHRRLPEVLRRFRFIFLAEGWFWLFLFAYEGSFHSHLFFKLCYFGIVKNVALQHAIPRLFIVFGFLFISQASSRFGALYLGCNEGCK